MLMGLPQAGSTVVPVTTTTAWGVVTSLPPTVAPQALSKLSAYLDGGGGNQDSQVVMVLLQGATVVGISEPVTVPGGAAAGWWDFTSEDHDLDGVGASVPGQLGGSLLNPGSTFTLVLYSTQGNAARILAVPSGMVPSVWASQDTFGQQPVPGSWSSLGAWTLTPYGLPFYATLFPQWSAPEQESDTYLGRLPFEMSQRAFGVGVQQIPRGNTGITPEVTVGWHGVNFDVETGAFAIARTGGAVEGLVGERVLVIRRAGVYQKSVAVTLYAARNFPQVALDEDLSLTRRAFLQISGWEQDTVECDVLPLPATPPVVNPALQDPPILKPVNLSPPVISGSTQEFSTLTTTPGAWMNAPTQVDLQWIWADTLAPIVGAIGTSYTSQASDVGHPLAVIATARNLAGATAKQSAATATIQVHSYARTATDIAYSSDSASRHGVFPGRSAADSSSTAVHV